jgi:hypothetical protein
VKKSSLHKIVLKLKKIRALKEGMTISVRVFFISKGNLDDLIKIFEAKMNCIR